MAQQVKKLSAKTDHLSLIPHGIKEDTPASCPHMYHDINIHIDR